MKAALRANIDAMDGLRRMSSTSERVGMTAEARQYASGALFELDESTRHQRNVADTDDGTAAGGRIGTVELRMDFYQDQRECARLEHTRKIIKAQSCQTFLAEDIKATQIIQYSGFANFLFAKNLKEVSSPSSATL